MPTALDNYLDILKPGFCDCCDDGLLRHVYTDPETNCRYCLFCLELATQLEDELPEDPELTAFAREYIAATRCAGDHPTLN